MNRNETKLKHEIVWKKGDDVGDKYRNSRF